MSADEVVASDVPRGTCFIVRDKIEDFAADYNSTPCGVVVVVVVAAVAAVAVPPISGANEKWDNFLTL